MLLHFKDSFNLEIILSGRFFRQRISCLSLLTWRAVTGRLHCTALPLPRIAS